MRLDVAFFYVMTQTVNIQGLNQIGLNSPTDSSVCQTRTDFIFFFLKILWVCGCANVAVWFLVTSAFTYLSAKHIAQRQIRLIEHQL